MRRRDFLAAGLFAPALLGGCKFDFGQGFLAECRTAMDADSRRRLIDAFQGIEPARVWDCHAHLFGNGRSKSGIWVNDEFDRPYTPAAMVRRAFFMNGGCAGGDEARVDQAMVARLKALVDQLPAGAKVMLLAFDFTYDEKGKRREELTTFAVSNDYARTVARALPGRFEWIASVHPYREDAIAALEAAKASGARAVKWLPPTMAIDLGEPRSLVFYDALKRLELPLLVHLGEEQAVHGAGRGDLANPLMIRHVLDRGVRVIAAHCASLGTSPDLDANRDPAKAPQAGNFELFTRLMGEQRYQGLLHGDISAVTQSNRPDVVIPTLLAKSEWHARLLNGSDYPLPGIMPLFSLKAFVAAGLLDERLVPALRELREANALAFDFVLKRNLTHRGARFPASVFETRGFFERAA